jgi:hypothetical protein
MMTDRGVQPAPDMRPLAKARAAAHAGAAEAQLAQGVHHPAA